MHKYVIGSDALERADDKAKLKSCSDGFLDSKSKFEMLRDEGVILLFNTHVRPAMKQNLAEIEGLNFLLDDQAFEREDMFASKFVSNVSLVAERQRTLITPKAFDVLVEFIAQTCAEELEKGCVVKRFTQLGALKLERDVRQLSTGICALASNPIPIRSLFARLLQLTALLSVNVIEEVCVAFSFSLKAN